MDGLGFVVAVLAAVFTGGQVWTAWLANRDSKRQHLIDIGRADADLAAKDARQTLEDRQVALAIHEELTSLQVQQAKVVASTDRAQREFLRALVSRCATRFDLLNAADILDDNLAASLQKELESIRVIDPEGATEAAAAVARKRGDRSRFTWAGAGSLSKLQLMQRIALEFAKTAPGREEFSRTFTAELSTAVGLEVHPAKFLYDLANADAAHTKVADQIGPLVLDGNEYVVKHSLGLPGSDYGVRIQLPVINHFRGPYPIGDAAE